MTIREISTSTNLLVSVGRGSAARQKIHLFVHARFPILFWHEQCFILVVILSSLSISAKAAWQTSWPLSCGGIGHSTWVDWSWGGLFSRLGSRATSRLQRTLLSTAAPYGRVFKHEEGTDVVLSHKHGTFIELATRYSLSSIKLNSGVPYCTIINLIKLNFIFFKEK